MGIDEIEAKRFGVSCSQSLFNTRHCSLNSCTYQNFEILLVLKLLKLSSLCSLFQLFSYPTCPNVSSFLQYGIWILSMRLPSSHTLSPTPASSPHNCLYIVSLFLLPFLSFPKFLRTLFSHAKIKNPSSFLSVSLHYSQCLVMEGHRAVGLVGVIFMMNRRFSGGKISGKRQLVREEWHGKSVKLY